VEEGAGHAGVLPLPNGGAVHGQRLPEVAAGGIGTLGHANTCLRIGYQR